MDLDEAKKIIAELEARIVELEALYGTERVVILDDEQWTNCWRAMCKELRYVPAWCDYPEYFKCVACFSTSDEGIRLVFNNGIDAMAFKLEWS